MSDCVRGEMVQVAVVVVNKLALIFQNKPKAQSLLVERINKVLKGQTLETLLICNLELEDQYVLPLLDCFHNKIDHHKKLSLVRLESMGKFECKNSQISWIFSQLMLNAQRISFNIAMGRNMLHSRQQAFIFMIVLEARQSDISHKQTGEYQRYPLTEPLEEIMLCNIINEEKFSDQFLD